MDQEKRNHDSGNTGNRPKRPVRYDENGRPIVPKKRPVRYDENGRPIVPQKRPVRYDENGRPIMPKKRPVRYDENGRPIRPKQPAGARPQAGNRPSGARKPVSGYEKYDQMETQVFDRRAFAEEKDNEARRRRESKKNKKHNGFGVFMVILQALASVVFFVLLNFLNMLPLKYMVVIGIILMILWTFTVLSQKIKSGRRVGKVYAVIITLILCVGSVYIGKAYNVMGQLTSSPKTKLSDVSIVVMQDSPAQALEDLAGKRFGVQRLIDKENTVLTIKDLEARLGEQVTTVEYESLKLGVQALYSGKVDAVVINEAYRSLIKENFPEFDTETRVLDAFTYEKEIEETSKADVKVDTEPFNVYLSGNDEWGEVKLNNGRTDVNIIATVNPATKQILLTTTPRDYYVELPYYGMDKLTHASVTEDGIHGSIATLENLYGIELNYYVRINFSGFQNIVDALGGVNVNSEFAFTTRDGSKSFEKGYNYVNGYEALLFVRERYAFSDGDLQRGRNQMAMIQAMMDKIFSPAILTNYMSLMDSLSSCFITDMPSNKIGDLVKMQLNDGAEWNIVTNSVLGYAEEQYSAMLGENASVLNPDLDDLEQARELIQSCMNGDIIHPPVKKYSYNVQVYDPYVSPYEESSEESSEEESSEESFWWGESEESSEESSESSDNSEFSSEESTESGYESESIPVEESSAETGGEESIPEEVVDSGDY